MVITPDLPALDVALSLLVRLITCGEGLTAIDAGVALPRLTTMLTYGTLSKCQRLTFQALRSEGYEVNIRRACDRCDRGSIHTRSGVNGLLLPVSIYSIDYYSDPCEMQC